MVEKEAEVTLHPKPKVTKNSDDETIHHSVAALIERDGKFLLIDRANPPFGFAAVAGHVDEGESPEIALVREVFEESGLRVVEYELIAEEVLDWNWCSKGVKIHHWHMYECTTEGEVKQNLNETKSIGWYSKEEIGELVLEPAWEYWLKKLEIIK